MKSFFVKLGGLLLCGVMLTVAGCHDYSEDIQNGDDQLRTEMGGLSAELADLKTTVAGLDAEYEALGAVEEAVDALKKELEGAISSAVKNAEDAVKSLQDALSGKADAGDVTQLRSDLEAEVAKLNEAIESAGSGVTGALEGYVTESELEEAVAKVVEQMTDKAETLQEAIDELEKALENNADKEYVDNAVTVVSDKVSELTDAVEKLSGRLDAVEAAIAEHKEAIDEVKAAFEKADEELDGKIAENAEAIAELTAMIETLKTDSGSALDAAVEELRKTLEERIAVSEAELDMLFARIQSVVLKPEYSDGKARVSYAKVGESVLEGFSTVTYKVYPASCVETIVNAFGAEESKLSLSLDAISVKSGESLLQVIDAEAGDGEGDLVITYKANLGAEFYADENSYSAALVFAFGDDEKAQNFSTEYTNFVAAESVKTWTLVPYYKNESGEYVAVGADGVSYEWYFVATGKEHTVDILPEIKAMFESGEGDSKVSLSAEEFAEMGYDAGYTVKTEVEYAADLPEQPISIPWDGENNVAACLVPGADRNKITSDENDNSATVTKTITWNGAEYTAVAKLSIVDFPYELKVTAPKDVTYEIDYTDKEKSVVVFGGDDALKLDFVNKNDETDVISAEDAVAEWTELVIRSNWSFSGKGTKSFVYTSESEDYVYPYTVKLADNVSMSDVGNRLGAGYKFWVPVLGEEETTVNVAARAYIYITPVTYTFILADAERIWNYAEDAEIDAAIYKNESTGGKYVYKSNVAVAEGGLSQGDLNLSDVLEDATYFVDGAESEDVTFTVNEDGTVGVEFTGFEWGKTHEIKAEVVLYSGATDADGNEIPAACANVNFKLKTVDRNREPVTFKAEPVTAVFEKDMSKVIAENQSLDALYEMLTAVPEGAQIGNLDADADVKDEYLLNNTSSDATVLEFGEGNSLTLIGIKTVVITLDADKNEAESGTEDETAQTGYSVTYDLSKQPNIVPGQIMRNLTAVKTITTWYGQKIVIEQPVELVAPEYDFAPVPQYVAGNAAAGYYSVVIPKYVEGEDGSLTDFSTELDLTAVFSVVKDGATVSAEDLASAGVSRTFEIIGNTDEDITLDDSKTKISYNGKAESVNVNGVLGIVNSNGLVFPITETIFSGDYKSFEVRKFDPLAENMTVLEGRERIEKTISEAEEYSFNVLENYSLLDTRQDEVLNEAMMNVYKITASYMIESVMVDETEYETLPDGITFDGSTGVITVDNTGQAAFVNTVTVKVSASVAYPQGERTGAPVTYVFSNR